MTLNVNNGQVDGTYEKAVGSAQGKYLLTGRTDIDPIHETIHNVWWVVMWEGEKGNTDSLTSGQVSYRKLEKKK